MEKRKKRWAEIKAMRMGYYHLCTDGWKDGKLFHTQRQFACGMTSVALMTIHCNVTVYEFELMPNHIHIVLSGTGESCLEAFCFLKRRISRELAKDGCPEIPEDYDFQLIRIETEQQLKNNLIYVIRNPYEKEFSSPGAYPWCSGYLFHSSLSQFIRGTAVASLSQRSTRLLVGSKIDVPGDWLISEELGILPHSFVRTAKFYQYFPTPKDFTTAVVKDYESFVKIASRLSEDMSFNSREADDMTKLLLQTEFGGQRPAGMSTADKYRLVRRLHEKYKFESAELSRLSMLPEYLVRQVLHSKDYGVK